MGNRPQLIARQAYFHAESSVILLRQPAAASIPRRPASIGVPVILRALKPYDNGRYRGMMTIYQLYHYDLRVPGHATKPLADAFQPSFSPRHFAEMMRRYIEEAICYWLSLDDRLSFYLHDDEHTGHDADARRVAKHDIQAGIAADIILMRAYTDTC